MNITYHRRNLKLAQTALHQIIYRHDIIQALTTAIGLNMELLVSEQNHYCLLEISGRIDSYSTPQIEAVLNSFMTDNHYNIIVNLQNVSYISSSGILTFVKFQRKLKQQNKGQIVFLCPPPLVFQSFAIAGFDTVFEFSNDLDAIKEWF